MNDQAIRRAALAAVLYVGAAAFVPAQALPWDYPVGGGGALGLVPAPGAPGLGSGFLEDLPPGLRPVAPADAAGWEASYGFIGGLADRTLFLLPSATWAGLFQSDAGGPDAFIGFTLGLGRDQSLEVDADNYAVARAAAGFVGRGAVPWLLRGDALYDLRVDIYPSLSLELSAELSLPELPAFRAYPRLYGGYRSGADYGPYLGAAAAARYLAMDYEGALARGWSAAAELGSEYDPLLNALGWSAEARAAVGLMPVRILGLGLELRARASDAAYGDWARLVRGVGDYRAPLAGSYGLAAAAELRLLAARGKLLKNPAWDLDALLSFFTDAAWAAGPARAVDDPAGRLLGAGVEFGLYVPAMPRSGLRAGAGLDLSALLRSQDLVLGSDALELFLLLAVSLP